MNINRYIAKYDFEIARKVKGAEKEKVSYTDKQKIFHRIAMLEMLHDVSMTLNGGSKYYNQVALVDGTVL